MTHAVERAMDLLVLEIHREENVTLTTNSFPAFSGLLASLTAAAAAAPEEIPTYKI